MKLNEAIAMVEDWLEQSTYGYEIYKIEKKESAWRVFFYEYAPMGTIECDSYFDVPIKKRCLINSLGHDVLDIGRFSYSTDREMMKWFKEFEKKWNYDDGKRKVKVFYSKTVEVEVMLDQEEIERFAVDGPPDWVDEKANDIDNEQPLEVEGFKVVDEKGE